jgi:hypothetical protein
LQWKLDSGGGNYCPDANVTRAEMVVLLHRENKSDISKNPSQYSCGGFWFEEWKK